MVHGDSEDYTKYLRKLANIKWNKYNQEAFDLCKDYTKLVEPGFSMAEYVANEHQDREYIVKLLDITDFSDGIFNLNVDKLIKTQDTDRVNNALIGLKGKTVNEALRDIKDLKGVQIVQPMSLTEVKEQRLIDREYEKAAPSTGYKNLDTILKGFVANHTITMTGETNVGKTQACCNFAYNVAKQGKRVLYFSLEPDISVIEYLASIWAKKRYEDTTEDDLTPPKDIAIDIYTKEHVNSLENMVNIVENSERYDLIIIDHFGYFTSTGRNKTQVESNAMKIMASFSKRNKTCVLIVVHPRKTPAGKKQRNLSIQDISGSAAFSQDATDVMIIVRRKKKKNEDENPFNVKYSNKGYIVVHKTKAGGNGAVAINFVDGSALILEQEPYEEKMEAFEKDVASSLS